MIINATPLGMSGISYDYTDLSFLDKLNKNIFLGGNESLSSENIIINSTFQSKSQINEYLLKIIKKIGQDKTIVILSPVRNPS